MAMSQNQQARLAAMQQQAPALNTQAPPPPMMGGAPPMPQGQPAPPPMQAPPPRLNTQAPGLNMQAPGLNKTPTSNLTAPVQAQIDALRKVKPDIDSWAKEKFGAYAAGATAPDDYNYLTPSNRRRLKDSDASMDYALGTLGAKVAEPNTGTLPTEPYKPVGVPMIGDTAKAYKDYTDKYIKEDNPVINDTIKQQQDMVNLVEITRLLQAGLL